jgi:hypothetical protein
MIVALVIIASTDTLLNALIFFYLWRALHMEVTNGQYSRGNAGAGR